MLAALLSSTTSTTSCKHGATPEAEPSSVEARRAEPAGASDPTADPCLDAGRAMCLQSREPPDCALARALANPSVDAALCEEALSTLAESDVMDDDTRITAIVVLLRDMAKRSPALRAALDNGEPTQRIARALPTSTGTCAPQRRGAILSVTPDRMTVLSGEGFAIEGGVPRSSDVDGHTIEPLRVLLDPLARLERQRSASSRFSPAPRPRLAIEADRTIPYGTLVDIILTARGVGFEAFAIAVEHEGQPREIVVEPPVAWAAPADPLMTTWTHVATLEVDTDGMRMHPGGPIADAIALEAAAERLATSPERAAVTVRVHASLPVQAVVVALDALRGRSCDLTDTFTMGGEIPESCALWLPHLDLIEPVAAPR